MSDHNDEARKQLKAAGVAERHHDELLGMKSQFEARGLNWLAVLDAIAVLRKAIDAVPGLIEIIKRLVEEPQAQTQAAPKS